jgi:hypothetical protein
VDRHGALTVVWMRNEGSHYDVFASSRPAHGGWSDPERIAGGSLPDLGLSDFDMKMAPSGAAIVAVGNIDHTSVQAIYRSRDGVWTKPRDFSVGGNYPVLDVTIDARGQATLAINGRGLSVVQHSGRRWRAPVVLGGRPGFAFDIDAGRPGEVLVVYKTGAKSYTAGRFVDGKLTGRSLNSLGSMGNVQLDAMGDGSATYLWNVGRELHAVHESSAGELGEATVISLTRPRWSLPLVTSGPGGKVLATWAVGGQVYVTFSSAASEVWSAPVDVSEGYGAMDEYGVKAAYGSDGSVLLVWQDLRKRADGIVGTMARRARPAT